MIISLRSRPSRPRLTLWFSRNRNDYVALSK
jgi:hypothetical protein